MSKERELLESCLDEMQYHNLVCPELKIDIKELLAQPEHIADVGNMVVQEPVAWKVIDGTNGNYMFSRIKPTERSYKYDVVIPLYTTPPKREPLGLEIMDVCGSEDYREGFKDGALYAEKCHGIGVDDDN